MELIIKPATLKAPDDDPIAGVLVGYTLCNWERDLAIFFCQETKTNYLVSTQEPWANYIRLIETPLTH
jgi:hypothetical protein